MQGAWNLVKALKYCSTHLFRQSTFTATPSRVIIVSPLILANPNPDANPNPNPNTNTNLPPDPNPNPRP